MSNGTLLLGLATGLVVIALVKRRRGEAGGFAGSRPSSGGSSDRADAVATGACIVGTTAAGLPILAPGCAPFARAADGQLRAIPAYVYATNPALVVVNPVIGAQKIKEAASWTYDHTIGAVVDFF